MTKDTAGATARATSRAKDLIDILSRFSENRQRNKSRLRCETTSKGRPETLPGYLGRSFRNSPHFSKSQASAERGWADYSYKLNAHHGRDHFSYGYIFQAAIICIIRKTQMRITSDSVCFPLRPQFCNFR